MTTEPHSKIETIDVVPNAIYIKFELDDDNSLTSYIWSQTDNDDLQCLVRGMMARLTVDQEEWMHLGDYINSKNGGLKTMIPEGNA